MRLTVSDEDVRRYRADGFIHVRSLLDAEEVAALKRAIDAAVSALGKRKIAGDGRQWKEGDDYYDRVFTQRLNLWKINATIRDFTQDRQLGDALRRLSGAKALRVWHDQALIKEPHANPTAWHLDDPYWSFYSRQAISLWIALEDVNRSNGCLYFLRGSHRFASYDNVPLGEDFGALFDVYPDMRRLEPVAVEMQAGDCSFHNGLTAHCAGPNVSRGRRIAMSCAYMPDGSTFNGQQNILSEAALTQLNVGDPLDDDEQNPIVP